MLSYFVGKRKRKPKQSVRKPLLKRRRSSLEPLEVRRMLTADPRIVGISAGNSAIYEGDTFALTASIDPNTPVTEVEFYLDDGDGVLNPSNDILLGTVTSGSNDQWTLASIPTGGTNDVTLGRQLFFAVATDDSWTTQSNTLAFPAEVLTSDPILRPIDNDVIVEDRLFVMTAKADLPPTTTGGTITYDLDFVDDTNPSEPTGVSFDADSGTLMWEPGSGDASSSPYHYQITATYDNGSSQVNSEPRDFYLTVVDTPQYLTTATGPTRPHFNNTSGPIFYSYRSSQSQGMRTDIVANIAPSADGAPASRPILGTLTYDTVSDLHAIVEADIPVDWLNSTWLPSAANLTVQVSVSDGTSTVAQSAVVYYSLAGIELNEDQYFHLAIPVDAALATGRYEISVELDYLNGSGVSLGTEDFGTADGTWANADLRIVNRSASDVGSGWAFAGLDQLVVQSDGVMLISGDGNVYWFEEESSGVYEAESRTNLELTVVSSNFRLVAPDTSYHEFDSTGRLLAHVDFLGNETTLEYYDPQDQSTGAKPDALKSITGPTLHTQTFEYANGMLTTVKDFAGRATTLMYTNGLLTLITRYDNATQEFAYDSNGLLVSKANPLGEIQYFEYDHLMRRVRTIYPDGAYEILHDSDTGSVAARTIVTYDNGQPVYLGSVDYPAPLIAWNIDSFGLDVASGTFMGAMGRVIAAGGNVLHFTTDTSGQVSSLTQPVLDDETAPWQDGTSIFRLRDLDTQLVELVVSMTPETEETELIDERYVYDDKLNLIKRYLPQSSSPTEEWDYTGTTNLYNRLFSYSQLGPFNPTRTTEYEYDTNGLLETITDPEGGESTFTYTDGATSGIPAGMVETITANGVTTEYAYFSAADSLAKSGLLSQIIVGSGTSAATTTLDYDAYGNLTRSIGPGDRVTDFGYDSMGRLTETHLRGLSTSLQNGPKTIFNYDAFGQVASVTDPEGNRTLYLYDLSHTLVSVVAPDPGGDGLLPGPQTVYYYGPNLEIDTIIDPMGRWTQYTYDVRGQLITVTEPDPDTGLITEDSPQTHYAYNDAGQIISVEEHHGVTKYDYDKWGQLKMVRLVDEVGAPLNNQSNGMLVSYSYNTLGDRITKTIPIDDGWLSTTAYEYDGLGRVKKVYLPNPTTGSSSKSSGTPIFYEYEYDANGRLFQVTAPSKDGTAAGAVTEYEYDDRGRIWKVILPPDGSTNSPTTEYTYDDTDFEFVSITDPTGNKTTWTFDVFGRIESELFEGYDASLPGLVTLGTRTYDYDQNGRLVELIDRNDRRIEFVYDALGRMTSENWYDTSSSQSSIRTLSYEYDWGGRLTATSDLSSASYLFEYDKLNRQTTSTVNLDGLHVSVTLASQYDHHGNREQLAASWKNLSTQAVTLDFVNNYGFDALHRVTSIEQDGQSGGNTVADKQVGLIYNDAGQLKQINRFNQIVGTPEAPTPGLYDASTNPNGAIAISNYVYDHAGRLTDLDTDLLDTTTSSITQEWVYDLLNRVTQYTNSSDSYFNGGVTDYDYDDLNQLIEEDPGASQTYDYDLSGNREMTGYVFGPGNRIEEDGTWTYTYDDEGNLVSRYTGHGLTQTFTYDHRNRLTDIELVNGSTTYYILHYDYDTFNRRVAREETHIVDANGGEGGGGGTTSETTAEKFVYDGDNVVLDFYKPVSGGYGLEHRYLFGPAVDQVLAQENVTLSTANKDRVYWLLSDNLGSTRDLVANDGTLVAGGHFRYSAFGTVLDGDFHATRYLYTGREYDAATELQYNRNRWYDSYTGRWLSEDPIGFAGGDSNLYRYVGNSPTNYRDPSGLVHQAPPAGFFEDPRWGDVHREAWDTMAPLRAHGGEGEGSSTSSPSPPLFPPFFGPGFLDPPGWPTILAPPFPEDPPPGDTFEDFKDFVEDALQRTVGDWVGDFASDYFDDELSQLPQPIQDMIRGPRGPTGPQGPVRGVENPGPLRGLLPRGSTTKIRLRPGGAYLDIRF